MARTSETSAQEVTILGLSKSLIEQANKLNETLERIVFRCPPEEGKCEGRPESPNVLDEIIYNLQDVAANIEGAQEYVVTDIKHKVM